jgi:hypothetical protein
MAGLPAPDTAHHRATVASIARCVKNGERPASDLEDARRGLAGAKLEDHVRKVLETAPRPTDAQLARVAALLNSGTP